MNYRNRTDALADFEENPSMLIVNPSRRRRRTKHRARSRTRRKMSALQRKYFGGGRKRRGKRRGRTITIAANPARRRSKRRSFRRNPINLGRMRASMGSVTGALKDAAVGAGGAILVDMGMAQAARFLPASLSMRYGADGSVNWGYHATKAALAVGLGVVGARFLPGRAKGLAARAAVGSLTVQAYDLGKSMLPAELTMGYYNPARVAGLKRLAARGVGRVGRMGAYLPARGMGRMAASFPNGSMQYDYAIDSRVGEQPIS